MQKVLKIAAHKHQIKEKDLQEELAADIETGGQEKKSKVSIDEKVFGKDKDVAKLDPFFVEADDIDGGASH